jgi:hypothetical protein
MGCRLAASSYFEVYLYTLRCNRLEGFETRALGYAETSLLGKELLFNLGVLEATFIEVLNLEKPSGE